jgi:hypothetical protein
LASSSEIAISAYPPAQAPCSGVDMSSSQEFTQAPLRCGAGGGGVS